MDQDPPRGTHHVKGVGLPGCLVVVPPGLQGHLLPVGLTVHHAGRALPLSGVERSARRRPQRYALVSAVFSQQVHK